MNEVLIGNACSIGAMVTDAVASTRKKYRQILAIQIISQLFYAAGSIVLKGYSGTVQNAVTILRNLAAIKNIKSKVVEWILIVLGVALGVIFNNRGILGWLPIVANFEYSVAVFRFKNNERALKISLIIDLVMYAVFSAVIQNYVGVGANLFVAVTAAVSIIKGRKRKTEESDGEIIENNENEAPRN
ncbi:MAG: YgjV family protein [Clostridia bacterium]|nr:YgjV family protein [Clostridia bacterium]